MRAVGFALVGVTGLAVNLFATWLLGDPATLGMHYILAAALATQVSSTWNFLLTDGLVYRGPRRYTKTKRWLGFMVMSNAVPAITLGLGFLVRFKSQERLTLLEETA
jgi:putative flippase GtrA